VEPPESSFLLQSNKWYKDVLNKMPGYEISGYQLEGIRKICNKNNTFVIVPTGASKSNFITGLVLADFAAIRRIPITVTIVTTKSLPDNQLSPKIVLKHVQCPKRLEVTLTRSHRRRRHLGHTSNKLGSPKGICNCR
jgi:reverse gyrase